MQTFVHVCAVLTAKERLDADFWLNTNQIISIRKQDGETLCTIKGEQASLVIDKRFTENINEILADFIEPPKRQEIDW